MEYHASLVTWQQVAKQTGATYRFVSVTEDGHLDMDHAENLIGRDTTIVSMVHVSNVLGTVTPVTRIADLAHENDDAHSGRRRAVDPVSSR